jgi:hypothetical protein
MPYAEGISSYDYVTTDQYANMAAGQLTLGPTSGGVTGFAGVEWNNASQVAGNTGPAMTLSATDGATTMETFIDILSPKSSRSYGIVNVYSWEPTASVAVPCQLNVYGSVNAITSGAIETWHALTPGNSWSNSGSGPDLQYRMLASPPNTVEIIGDLATGTVTNGTVIATLPYTANSNQVIAVTLPSGTPTSINNCRLFYTASSGTIACEGMAGLSGRVAIHAFISLDA